MISSLSHTKGKARKESSLNADQKLQRITAPPSVLEYFCYVFNFHSLLAGPSCTLHEFQAFMDGSNLRPMENPNAYALVSYVLNKPACMTTFFSRPRSIAKSHLPWYNYYCQDLDHVATQLIVNHFSFPW